jgi:pantoate--beta-alanine ligase
MQLNLVKNIEGLQQALAGLKTQGSVGFVPTMGALHAGHASLIKRASERSKNVVVSVFVNPIQFGPNEDFAKYPKMLEKDMETAKAAGASLIYAPSAGDIYPEGFSTSISAGDMSKILDGAFRPGHFDGVATVVAKLLLRVLPQVVVFGEKDYQQLCVIRRVVRDLDLPVEIIAAPTMRETGGLAMSSRNAYLTPEERKTAPEIYITLRETAKRIKAGVPHRHATAEGVDKLSSMGFKVDYLELRDAATLDLIESLERPARLLVAAWLGSTRLIDNIVIG